MSFEEEQKEEEEEKGKEERGTTALEISQEELKKTHEEDKEEELNTKEREDRKIEKEKLERLTKKKEEEEKEKEEKEEEEEESEIPIIDFYKKTGVDWQIWPGEYPRKTEPFASLHYPNFHALLDETFKEKSKNTATEESVTLCNQYYLYVGSLMACECFLLVQPTKRTSIDLVNKLLKYYVFLDDPTREEFEEKYQTYMLNQQLGPKETARKIKKLLQSLILKMKKKRTELENYIQTLHLQHEKKEESNKQTEKNLKKKKEEEKPDDVKTALKRAHFRLVLLLHNVYAYRRRKIHPKPSETWCPKERNDCVLCCILLCDLPRDQWVILNGVEVICISCWNKYLENLLNITTRSVRLVDRVYSTQLKIFEKGHAKVSDLYSLLCETDGFAEERLFQYLPTLNAEISQWMSWEPHLLPGFEEYDKIYNDESIVQLVSHTRATLKRMKQVSLIVANDMASPFWSPFVHVLEKQVEMTMEKILEMQGRNVQRAHAVIDKKILKLSKEVVKKRKKKDRKKKRKKKKKMSHGGKKLKKKK